MVFPCPNSSNKTSYTLGNVTQAHTVTVVFATTVRYDVSAVNGVGGTLISLPTAQAQLCPQGGRPALPSAPDLVFAAVPSSGMMTGRWTVNGIAVTGRTCLPRRDYGSLPVQHTDH